jgi:hypothetical protein
MNSKIKTKQINIPRQRIKAISASTEEPQEIMIKFVKTTSAPAKTIAQTFAEIIKFSESIR